MSGESKIENLGQTFGADHHIAGLQIAVNHAAFVSFLQRLSDLRGQHDQLFFGPGFAGAFLGQRFSREIFHYQEVGAVLGDEFVNGGDAGMIQFGEDQRFGAKTFARVVIAQRPRREKFQRHVAIEMLVMRAVHHAHATRPDHLQDAIVRNRAADDGRGIGHGV